MHDQCSKASWSRVHARSQDLGRLKQAVKNHLIESSLHYIEEPTADDIVELTTEWEAEEETYADREKYRKSLDQQAAKQKTDQEKAAIKGKGKTKDKGKNKDNGPYTRPCCGRTNYLVRSVPPRTVFTDADSEGQQANQMEGLHGRSMSCL